jgi:hypothetical protein
MSDTTTNVDTRPSSISTSRNLILSAGTLRQNEPSQRDLIHIYISLYIELYVVVLEGADERPTMAALVVEAKIRVLLKVPSDMCRSFILRDGIDIDMYCGGLQTRRCER